MKIFSIRGDLQPLFRPGLHNHFAYYRKIEQRTMQNHELVVQQYKLKEITYYLQPHTCTNIPENPKYSNKYFTCSMCLQFIEIAEGTATCT